MVQLSEPTKNLIVKYELWQQSLKPKENVATIHVDEVALKVAAFYEHIRTIVEWKEEHLMRRAAIIRKLKRRFFDLQENSFSVNDVAEALVLELIRGGYFPNDRIEESKIASVQKIVNKYVSLLKQSNKKNRGKSGLQFYTRLLEIAACEIEETLDPSIKEMALIDYMFDLMKKRIKVNENVYATGLLTPEEKDIQIYISVQQALFKLDQPIISYNLIKYKHPKWDNPSPEELAELTYRIHDIIFGIERDLDSPLGKKFYAISEKYDTAYLLIGDILSKEGFEKIQSDLQEPALLEGHVRSAYTKRLQELKAKITRAAVYSTISIFITKILSLVALEIILQKVLKEHFNLPLLLVDILIPTALMALLVLSVKPPSKKNINLAVIEVVKIVYQKEKTDTYEIKMAKKKGVAVRLVLSFTYLAGACVSFGAIYWVFSYFSFPITSIIINIVFIALILFAG